MKKVLFILKRRHDYVDTDHGQVLELSTGLYHSVKFINEALIKAGIESSISIVIDNNDIDREVTKYKPDFVIIEALWVVPSKFAVLTKLHPNIKWFIRIHSELPFIANEGIAMDWIGDYIKFKNVFVAANSERMFDEMQFYASTLTEGDKILFLPNYYPQTYKKKKFGLKNDTVNISSFGAIRPLKNQLMQAIAALKFAQECNLKLNFHINGTRIEQKGQPVLNNLKALFQQEYSNGHRLICHPWMTRDLFEKLCGSMDIGMQISFSETFNIVAADHTAQGVPIVPSYEIPWASKLFSATPTDCNQIVKKLHLIRIFPGLNTFLHKYNLTNYTEMAQEAWLTEINRKDA